MKNFLHALDKAIAAAPSPKTREALCKLRDDAGVTPRSGGGPKVPPPPPTDG